MNSFHPFYWWKYLKRWYVIKDLLENGAGGILGRLTKSLTWFDWISLSYFWVAPDIEEGESRDGRGERWTSIIQGGGGRSWPALALPPHTRANMLNVHNANINLTHGDQAEKMVCFLYLSPGQMWRLTVPASPSATWAQCNLIISS